MPHAIGLVEARLDSRPRSASRRASHSWETASRRRRRPGGNILSEDRHHWQLVRFRDGRRKDPQMSPLAQNLSDTDMADLAAYYQAQQPRPRPTATATRPRSPPARRSRCFIIAPPVTGPGSPGRSRCRAWPARTTTTPSGCSAGSKAKTASNLDGTMTIAARPLGDEEIVSLAHYIASLGAEP